MIASKSDPVLPNPSSITFGTVFVGQPATQTLTFTNFGAAATGPLTITISGTGSAQVTIVESTCTAALAPGASCQIKLQYLPIDTTGVNGTLTLSEGSASLSISMGGAAMAPVVDGSADAAAVIDAAVADGYGRVD